MLECTMMDFLYFCTIIFLLQQLVGNNKIIVKGFVINQSITKHSYISTEWWQSSSSVRSKPQIIFFAKNDNNGDDFGVLSVSNTLPKFEEEMINRASEVLSWEQQQQPNEGEEEGVVVVVVCWRNGEIWKETRVELVRLWVLPRDMTNGSWETYTLAANKGEIQLLQNMPQLLRLPTDQIVDSANTILKTLKLPPALLRKEPILLSIPPFLLEKGFETILLDQKSKMDSGATTLNDDELRAKYYSETIKMCRDTPGLLAETAIRIFIDLY